MPSKTRQSKYPIGTFLIQIWNDSGLSLPAFISSLDYSNTSKAIRRFDAWLRHGTGEAHILQSVRRVRPEQSDALARALDDTREILLEEQKQATALRIANDRATFVPFLQAIPERKQPSSITFYAVTGGSIRERITLPPAILDSTEYERNRIIASLIKQHMTVSKGRTLFQGRIVTFQAFLLYDSPPLTFSTDGALIGVEQDHRPGDATLTIGKRPFPGRFG